MSHKVLDFLPKGQSSLEHDLFPKLVEMGLIIGREFQGYFVDIGIPIELKNAQSDLLAWSKRNELFKKK